MIGVARIDLAPPIPDVVAVLLAAAGIAIACAAYSRPQGGIAGRRMVATALRVLALLAIGLLLLGPVEREWPDRPPSPATIAILLDVSRSMATRDVDGLARIEAARRTILGADPERALAPARIAWFAFDRDARAIDAAGAARIPADGPGTAIGLSLAEAFASTLDLAGAIVLSDGRDTSGSSIEDVAARARARRAPIWTIPFGAADAGPDLAIAARPATPYAIAGATARIEVTVYGTGLDQRTVEIALLRGGAVASIRRVSLGQGPETIVFPVAAEKPGSQVFLVRAAPIPGETNRTNNEASAVVRVTDRRIRALYLEGAAGRATWDTTFILRALRRDARLAPDAIRLGGDPRAIQAAEGAPPAAPLDAKALASYDVVLIAGGAESLLADPSALSAFVEAGGAAIRVVPAEGDPFPLARIEGVGAGAHPVIEPLAAFASAASARGRPILAVRGEAPRDARILARGVSAHGAFRTPVVWIRAAGQGSEASVNVRDLWRGAIGIEEGAQDRDAFASSWARFVVWLAERSRFPPGARVALDIPDPAWDVGREGTIIARARDPEAARGLALEIVAPDGSRSRRTLEAIAGDENAFQARVTPAEAGLHRADLVDAAGAVLASEPFAVAGPPGEDALVAADRAALERLSAASGGRTVEARDLAPLLSEIAESLRPADALPVTRDLGDRPVFLMAIAALLAAEWILRRRGGLP